MAAAFDFNSSGRLGRERNLYQGGGRRTTVQNKEIVGKWGSKDYACQKSFVKLSSPTNRVLYWCSLTPAVNHMPNVSFERHSDISLSREESGRYRALIVKFRFDSALDEALTPTALR